jgi:exodeoxyribonuclease-3
MSGERLRVATWNVNSLRVRVPHLSAWLESTPIDVLALQETKLTDAEFPAGELAALGLTGVWHGQKTYNGVALLARQPVSEVLKGMPGFADEQARVVAATVAGIRIVDVYVPNGQSVGSEKYAYKLRWLAALRDFLKGEIARHPELLLLGDCNIAPEDRDVHDPKAWEGQVLVSPAERAALGEVCALGLEDLFRRFEQAERSFSWWDYRAAAYRRNAGLRIDLILATPALAARCTACDIDRAPRGWERPSDHTPVIATFDLSARQ